MDISDFTGKRVILTSRGNLSYAGRCFGTMSAPCGKTAVAIVLDEASGFSVLCPVDYIQRLLVLPVDIGDRARLSAGERREETADVPAKD